MFWFDGADEMSDVPPDIVDGSFLCDAHPVLDLGESLFDRVEVRRVFGEEPEPCADGLDGVADGFGFMAAEIVHDDDVAGLQRRDENLFDVSTEAEAIDGAVEDGWRGKLIAAQSAHESQSAPVPMGCKAAQSFACRSPAPQRRHIGSDPGLVDEDKPVRIEAALPCLPALAATGDV